MPKVCRSCCTPVDCGLIVVTPTGCAGAALLGATVTVTLSGTTIGTGTTVAGVSAINLGSSGSLYLSAPTVSLSGGGGSGATAALTMGTSSVRTPFTLTNAGTGYTYEPAVTISGGGGSGATATARHVSSAVTALQLISGGTGYGPGTGYNLDFSSGGASATFDVDGTGAVTNLVLTGGGSGYTAWPTLDFSEADFGGVTVTAVGRAGLASGALGTPVLGAGGSGFTSNPTVTIDPPPSGTTATATVKAGAQVASIRVTATGSGYTSAPTVTIGAPQSGGTTATATAIRTNGVYAVQYSSAANYTIAVSATHYNTSTTTTGSLGCTPSNTIKSPALTAATGYSCTRSLCCNSTDQPDPPPYAVIALPSTITLTDPFGGVTLTFNPAIGFGAGAWEGYVNRTAATGYATCGGANPPPSSNVTVPVYYRLVPCATLEILLNSCNNATLPDCDPVGYPSVGSNDISTWCTTNTQITLLPGTATSCSPYAGSMTGNFTGTPFSQIYGTGTKTFTFTA